MRRTVWTIALFGAGLATGLCAQTGPQEVSGGQPPAERMRRRRAGPPPGFRLRVLVQRLPRVLELDEAQRAKFDEIVAKYRERMEAAGGERSAELLRRMRQARQSGDEQRLRELRDELRQQRRAGQRLVAQLLDEVEGILREEQVAKLRELRPRLLGPTRGGPDLRERLSQLRRRLNLDEQQQSRFDELLARLREQGAEHRRQMEKLRPLVRELREARRAGDEERAAELRAALDAQRPKPAKALESFLGDLEQILNQDQKAILAEFRQELRRARPGARTRAAADVRAILRAARRLELDGQQRARLKEISRDALRRMRELGRGDRQARVELAGKVRQEVLALLDAEQAEQFEKYLAQPPPPRRAGPPEAGRHGQRRRARPPGDRSR